MGTYHKIVLSLFTIPTLTGSILATSLTLASAAASESTGVDTVSQACTPTNTKQQPFTASIVHATRKGLPVSAIEIPVPLPETDFSAAESDAAVALFGCDCPACIGALRQLRSESLLNRGQGHCWLSLQRRASPADVQTVLQILEAETTNQTQ